MKGPVRILSLVLVALGASSTAFCTCWQEVRLTDCDSAKAYVCIDGPRIVWADDRNHGGSVYDIFCHDLETQTQSALFVHDARQLKPDVQGERVVFEDYRDKVSPVDPNVNIYMFDMSDNSLSQITTNEAGQFNPCVCVGKVYWHDDRNGQYDVYAFDMSTATEELISDNAGDKYYVRNSGDMLVWQDTRNGSFDVYGHDLLTGTDFPVCAEAGFQTLPRISGSIVVWQDTRNIGASGIDVWGRDLSSGGEFVICAATSHQTNPDISGRTVVWQDTRADDGDIYGIDLDTMEEMEISGSPGRQSRPRISGDIVAFMDNRGGHDEIYCARPLRIESIDRDSGSGGVVIRWSSLPGLMYVVQAGSDLDSFTDMSTPVTADGLSCEWQSEAGGFGEKVFYRVRLVTSESPESL